MKVSPLITTDMLGRLTVGIGEKDFPFRNLTFHILPRYDSSEEHQWGYSELWYDGPWPSFGFGPLLLVCWRFW